MDRRLWLLGLLPLVSAQLGASCGGGSGSGGSPPVIEVAGGECVTVGLFFPPGLDFVPGAGDRLVAANTTPVSVLPIDPEPVPPAIVVGSVPDLSNAIGLAACTQGGVSLSPVPGGITAVTPDFSLLTSSVCDSVTLVENATGGLADFEISVPPGLPVDFRFLPAGTRIEAPAVSTVACVEPGLGALDSLGDLVPDDCAGNGDPSFETSFTAGAAVSDSRLFVPTSNLQGGQGTATPQFLPGTVLVYDLDLTLDPPTVSPDATQPVVLLSGFNPTEATAYRTPMGRDLVLVTVTGALGLVSDDPSTAEPEAGGLPLSEAAIDVIDVATRELLATVPLGLAALSFDPLAIDPTGRVALTGSAVAREVFAIDLEALDGLGAPPADPFVLDGSDARVGNLDARIFDADTPFVVPARPGGADPATCAGFTVGVAFNDAGTRAFVTDFCDGTLTIVGVDVSGSPPIPVPNGTSRFQVLGQLDLVAPVGPQSVGLARALASVAVRPGTPGVDYQGPDVFVLVGVPEAQLCGVRVDSV